MRACQGVGADHLQTVTTRFVRAQHPRCHLDRLLDRRDLVLVDLEIEVVNIGQITSIYSGYCLGVPHVSLVWGLCGTGRANDDHHLAVVLLVLRSSDLSCP